MIKWLVFGIQPCRAAFYEFRDRLTPYLDQLSIRMLDIAQQQGSFVGWQGALGPLRETYSKVSRIDIHAWVFAARPTLQKDSRITEY